MQHPNHPISIIEGAGTTEETMVLEAAEDVVGNIEETGEDVIKAMYPVALITTDVHMVCVKIKAPILWDPPYGHQNTKTATNWMPGNNSNCNWQVGSVSTNN